MGVTVVDKQRGDVDKVITALTDVVNEYKHKQNA